MTRTAVALTTILSLAGMAGVSRTQQGQTPPVFVGRTDLVTIDVTVVDKDGQPVRGLKAEDFAVTLQGQTRPVVALDFQEFGAAAGSAATRESTNQSTRAPVRRGGRVVVLLFDDYSYKPGPGKTLLAAAERMVETFDVDDLVGVTTTSGLGPTVNPTRDRSAVLAALRDKTMVGRNDDSTSPFYITNNEAIEIDRGFQRDVLPAVAGRECPLLGMPPTFLASCQSMVEGTARAYAQQIINRTTLQLAAYQHLIEALRSAPAPRIVIALSNGVAIGSEQDIKRQLDPITRAAADAGVQFYALSEIGADAELGDADYQRAAARRADGAFLNSGAQTVAEAAGGEAFLVAGTADRFFQRIEAETSGIYRIGVQAPSGAVKQRFLSTKVSVRRSGTTVRVNHAAVMTAVAPESIPIDEQLKRTLEQGGPAFGVPVALATAQRRDPSGSLQLAVSAQMPSNVPGPLIVMYALVNEKGQVAQAGRRDVPPPPKGESYQLAFPVPIDVGKYRLRFVVADAKGAIGGVEHSITAGLAHFGAFAVSDLFTMWAGADRRPRSLALERLPDGAETLGASLELYPADVHHVPRDVVVQFALLAAGGDRALLERSITPAPVGATLSAIAELPVSNLEPGTYLIRATVLEGGTATGTVTTTIRKSGS